jgi:hypothetical protein
LGVARPARQPAEAVRALRDDIESRVGELVRQLDNLSVHQLRE